jgi:phosphoribosylanthranilate isomerase
MLVKICGITRAEDARAAVAAGANAIGFVFWPGSPRFIDPYRAREITASLPPFITTVGLFVDQPAEHICGVASLVRLSAVQLHGKEQPPFARSLGRPIIKAVSLEDGNTDVWPAEMTLLLDAHDPVRHGGTGRTIDWNAAARVAAKRAVLLAGGITPENVGDAVAHVHPFGIDVSSGVESAAGVKDHARIAALFKAIHAHASSRS